MFFNFMPNFAYTSAPSFPMFGANPFLFNFAFNPLFNYRQSFYPTYNTYYSIDSLFKPTAQQEPMPVMKLFGNNNSTNIFSQKQNNIFGKDYAEEFRQKTTPIINRVQRALALARSQVGVKEIGKTNDGTQIREYKNGAANNLPWCASFSSWLYGRGQNSSNKDTFGYTASSQQIMREADAKGHFAHKNSGYKPKAGDLVVWTKVGDADHGHVGIVDEVTSNGYWTIEGNTSKGVARKFYSFNKQDISSTLKFSGFAKMSEWLA